MNWELKKNRKLVYSQFISHLQKKNHKNNYFCINGEAFSNGRESPLTLALENLAIVSLLTLETHGDCVSLVLVTFEGKKYFFLKIVLFPIY